MKIQSKILSNAVEYVINHDEFIPMIEERDNKDNYSCSFVKSEFLGEPNPGKVFLNVVFHFEVSNDPNLNEDILKAAVKYNRSNGSYLLITQ